MEQQSNDQTSRLDEFQQRLQELMQATRGGIQRQAPEVLDGLAATAGSIARRLEDLAREARQRAEQEGSASESAKAASPGADQPGGSTSSPGGSGPAGA